MENDIKERTRAALVFPGVGVRLTGAETAFFESHRSVMRPLLREASYYCDTDLIALFFSNGIDSPADEKKQFFTYAFSAGAADVALNLFRPVAAAGYSFGIYAALYAAKVCSFSDGLILVDKANLTMQAESQGRSFGMGVVVGLTDSDIDAILRSASFETVLKTNTNHDHCHIFSGTISEIDAFLKMADAEGAFKSDRLEVSIPYHHPTLLQAVPKAFGAYADGISFKKAQFPIVSTIDGALLTEPEALRDFTCRHPAVPIHWRDALSVLHRLDVKTLYECGPGISLSQNGRFLSLDMTYIHVKKGAAWEKT